LVVEPAVALLLLLASAGYLRTVVLPRVSAQLALLTTTTARGGEEPC
jgi:hypothetical protein